MDCGTNHIFDVARLLSVKPEKESPVFRHGEYVNLNKYIAQSGLCSRRKVDDLIKSGSVKVNNVVVDKPYYKVEEGDLVTVDGKEVTLQNKVYVLLNKPKDYITTVSDERGRKTVLNLIDLDVRVYPVGRLDRNTTGVIILTNDGDLAQKLSHPSYEVKKVYHVTLDKNLEKAHFSRIQSGIELEDGFIKVDNLSYLDTQKEIRVELHSGRNRIVRRIFVHFGYEVVKLDRVEYAGLTQKKLPRSKWRYLTEEEVVLLKS